MAGPHKKTDPFELWRDQQRPGPAVDVPGPTAEEGPPRIRLSAGREALRDQAFDRMWDAKEAGDLEAFERTSRELVDLNRRLFLEQQAENGVLPDTIEGAIAALHVASQIIEIIGANQ